jgi:hypothetical protein
MKTTAIKGNARILRPKNSTLFLHPKNYVFPFSLGIIHSHNENL